MMAAFKATSGIHMPINFYHPCGEFPSKSNSTICRIFNGKLISLASIRIMHDRGDKVAGHGL